nr:hypothetical protein [Klebsiella pneumoniae]
MMQLFRKEALKHHNENEPGNILVPASFSLSLCAVIAILLFLCIALFIYSGKYTRKAHLTGIVMPSSGLVKIIPQYAGYITQLTASEGQHVSRVSPSIISAANILTGREPGHWRL